VSYGEYTREQIRALRDFYRVHFDSNTFGLNTPTHPPATRGNPVGTAKGNAQSRLAVRHLDIGGRDYYALIPFSAVATALVTAEHHESCAVTR